jgi:UDP-N-acetylmuramyl pentapeptide phosphotransferase/UDP-N-acetylglucosamine-1-phosphate transferase
MIPAIPQAYMVPVILILAFLASAALSLIFCGIARALFPKFRSGEHKPGPHRSDLRSDLPASGREIKTIELPLVGGPAFTLAMVLTGLAVGYLLFRESEQWALLLIGLGATLSFMLIGLIDDWHKVYSKEGLSERAKFASLFLISVLAAACYFFLTPKGPESYSPYIGLPIIGHLICPTARPDTSACPLHPGEFAYYAWLIFLLCMTGVTGSVTSLAVDFSDGLDGLAGGLVFSAALAFGIVTTGIITRPEGQVVEVLSLLCAGSTLGYLPWNWPSAWAARGRRSGARRRAQIYMGDSGALALGGLLAMIAIFDRQETLLFLVGAAFVLEGLSALSARLITRFYRRNLQILRFASSRDHIPHTEFPRPFLATPLHHHFDLLGWDRRRLVYGAWALGACFAVLGVMVGLAPETWQRYLGRILVLLMAWIVWSSGSWTRRYFVGKHPAERSRRRRLALFYGFPYRIMGIPLYHLVEVIEASEDVIETPAEELALWQRMTIFDARAMLGLYCYRAGYYPAALAQWTRIPASNRALRPTIARLLEELDSRLSLEKQETQPIRREDLLRHQEPPLLSGDLGPADLPNPHEPVTSGEAGDDVWSRPSFGKSGERSSDERGNDIQSTGPLQSKSLPEVPQNGHHALQEQSIRQVVGRGPLPARPRRNWLLRLLHSQSRQGL